jgi:regulator of replication initiation timing
MYLAYRLLDEMEDEIKNLKIENEDLVSEVIKLILENIKIKKELHDLKQSIIDS